MYVYPLEHFYLLKNGEEEIKELGIYSSKELAEAAIQRYCNLPGFRDYPITSFRVMWSKLDEDSAWTEGFISWEEASEPEEP